MGQGERLAAQPLWSEAALAIGRADRAFTARLARVVDGDGCSVERWRALAFLAAHGTRPMAALMEAALLPAPRLTRLVDGMVADNLVHRRADPSDRRRVLVGLTPRGRALHRMLAARLEAEQETIVAEIGAEHLELLTSMLSDLAARLR